MRAKRQETEDGAGRPEMRNRRRKMRAERQEMRAGTETRDGNGRWGTIWVTLEFVFVIFLFLKKVTTNDLNNQRINN